MYRIAGIGPLWAGMPEDYVLAMDPRRRGSALLTHPFACVLTAGLTVAALLTPAAAAAGVAAASGSPVQKICHAPAARSVLATGSHRKAAAAPAARG
jgi:hypothetical protein